MSKPYALPSQLPLAGKRTEAFAGRKKKKKQRWQPFFLLGKKGHRGDK